MARRIHVQQVRAGETVELARAEAHHARDVLRLTDGTRVEVFDDAGTVGEGVLAVSAENVSVRVQRADLAVHNAAAAELTIAAAVPKGDRADWMVEKLSELGVAEFIPLAAARSVVLPEGRGKRDRWHRIATEAAKQSRRAGVMRITELSAVADVVRGATTAGRRVWFLSTVSEHATPIAIALAGVSSGADLIAFVGPEGGWTAQEVQQFVGVGATPIRLTPTILRIETAAVAAAAAVMCMTPRPPVAGPLDGPAARHDDPLPNAAPRTGTTP